MQKVIGLLGVKGSGKDTAAQFLIDNRQYRRIGFADALYQEAAEAFGVTVSFLGNRATKETELPELALKNCTDAQYVGCVMGHTHTSDAEMDAFLSAPRSPRFILQYWGTQYRRKGYPGVHVGEDSYWLDRVRAEIEAHPQTNFVVTDVRFLNEFNFVKAIGGTLARVRRPDLEAMEALERAKSGRASHESETELLAVAADVDLFNEEGQLAALCEAILALAPVEALDSLTT